MKGKKLFLATLMDRLKILNWSALLRYRGLIVMNYHRVYERVLQTDFDEEVFVCDIETFTKQMCWLKENTNILSESDLIEIVESKRSIPKRSVMITFDDGYIDNYELAYPVLKKNDIPAIFFIPTGHINSRRLGWWDIIAYFIKKSTKKKIAFDRKRFCIASPCDRKKAIRYFLKYMKTAQYSQSQNLLNRLSAICEVDFPDASLQCSQLMTWEQIAEVRNANIAIGSHTDSHRVLATIDDEEQINELSQSKAILEEKLGCAITSVSYPVGSYTAFNERTKQAVQQAGYKIAFSFGTGVNKNYVKDPYDTKRISPNKDFAIFKGSVVIPSIFV